MEPLRCSPSDFFVPYSLLRRKEREAKRKMLPPEVLSIVLSYAVDSPLDPSGEVGSTLQLRNCSGHYLLGRRWMNALDELFVSLVDGEILRNRHTLCFPSEGCNETPFAVQKRILLAVSRSPDEVRQGIEIIDGHFLIADTTFSLFLSPAPFGGGESTALSGNHLRLRRKECEGDFQNFIVRPMRSLSKLHSLCARIGGTWISKVDLSPLPLRFIGDDFLRGPVVREVRFPSTLEQLGNGALVEVAIVNLDLSYLTRLKSIGNRFGELSSMRTVLLPSSLTSIGDDFLNQDTALQDLDLASTSITSIGTYFLSRCTAVRRVTLPSTLRMLGVEGFLGAASKLLELDMKHTKVTELSRFCSQARLQTTVFPATLTRLGSDCFFCAPNLRRLDLSGSNVFEIASRFCFESGVEEIAFPSSLTSIGNHAFVKTQRLRALDLSHTQLITLDQYFCCGSALEEIHFPPSLRSAMSSVFQETKNLRELDFSRTRLSSVSEKFAAGSGLQRILFPPSLSDIGPKAFWATKNLKGVMDLSHTNVKTLSPGVGLSSGINAIVTATETIELSSEGVERGK